MASIYALLIRALGTGKGLLIPIIVFGVMVLGALDWKRISNIKKEVRQQVIAEAKQEGRKANEQATEAHLNARKPGAFERLRNDKDVCRDC